MTDADKASCETKECHVGENTNDTDGAKTDPVENRAYSCKLNIELTTCAHIEVKLTVEVDVSV